jgi:hypothetical protein
MGTAMEGRMSMLPPGEKNHLVPEQSQSFHPREHRTYAGKYHFHEVLCCMHGTGEHFLVAPGDRD